MYEEREQEESSRPQYASLGGEYCSRTARLHTYQLPVPPNTLPYTFHNTFTKVLDLLRFRNKKQIVLKKTVYVLTPFLETRNQLS